MQSTKGLGIINIESDEEEMEPKLATDSTALFDSQHHTDHSKSSRSPGSPILDVTTSATADLFLTKWSTRLVFALSLWSTIGSCAWVLIAIIKPHYGGFVGDDGSLAPSTASTLTALVAKSIEMSFVSVFVVCLGQHLTIHAQEKGMRTSDLQLKEMLLLPGSFLTQKESFKAIRRKRFIGVGCIIAYFATALYTTASDSLVSPRPSLGKPVLLDLRNAVRTSMGNEKYISRKCPNPVSNGTKINDCIVTQFAGASLHDYMQFLEKWQPTTGELKNQTESDYPPPIGLWGANLTVQGLWQPTNSSEDLEQKYGRLITSSLLAMPHVGLVSATQSSENKLNKIPNKRDSDQRVVEVATVAPTVNVTCAVVTQQEILPLIYLNWTHTEPILQPTQFLYNVPKDATWRTNKTVLNDIFGLGRIGREVPVFYNLPENGRSLLDGVGTYRDMIYLLFKSSLQAPEEYTFCGISMTLLGGCSSVLYTNITGSKLQLNCDEDNPMAFSNRVTLSSTPSDWVDTANQWAQAIALGGGITNAIAAMPSMLNQMVPLSTGYDPSKPSLANSLAVLSICTLLSSAEDAPFDAIWPYDTLRAPNNTLSNPEYQPFQARVQVSDYASGSTNSVENLFLFILTATFLLNVICLAYLVMLSYGQISITRHGIQRTAPKKLQKDITDLHELFATAIASPRVADGDSPDDKRLTRDKNARWSYIQGIFVPADTPVHVLQPMRSAVSQPSGRTSRFREHCDSTPNIPLRFTFDGIDEEDVISGEQAQQKK